jgi:pyruvate dehydrogenase E2 component (dihydrolipoamide acetyltransferase)
MKASPLARKIAAELGVDLTTVKGSGPGGAIERADVERAAIAKKIEPPAPEGAPAEAREKFRAGMHRAIAGAMARSNRDIPHYYLQTRIDMTRALRWLEAENAKRSIKDRLLPAVLTLKAVALALRTCRSLTAFGSTTSTSQATQSTSASQSPFEKAASSRPRSMRPIAKRSTN